MTAALLAGFSGLHQVKLKFVGVDPISEDALSVSGLDLEKYRTDKKEVTSNE
jgi:hypothetical protein